MLELGLRKIEIWPIGKYQFNLISLLPIDYLNWVYFYSDLGVTLKNIDLLRLSHLPAKPRIH